MKKTISISILLFVFTVSAYTQVLFKKGYYISNSGKRTECLIRNSDWKNNPEKFKYKLSEQSNVQEASINSVKEFSILGNSKYIRKNVEIDTSTHYIDEITTNKHPEFTERQVFLKVLLEGKASLYKYEDSHIVRFFYNYDTSNIEQLVYKIYRADDGISVPISHNRMYRIQLWDKLRYEGVTVHSLKNIDYKEKDILKYFLAYNKYHNVDMVIFEIKEKRDLLSITPKIGLRYHSVSVSSPTSATKRMNFGSQLGYYLGADMELALPFKRKKWALIAGIYYSSFQGGVTNERGAHSIDYKVFEFPIGLRYSSFLTEKSKLYLSTLYSINTAYDSKIETDILTQDMDIITIENNFVLEFGYRYNNQYSIDLRYGFTRDILADYYVWDGEYPNLSVSFGYTIF